MSCTRYMVNVSVVVPSEPGNRPLAVALAPPERPFVDTEPVVVPILLHLGTARAHRRGGHRLAPGLAFASGVSGGVMTRRSRTPRLAPRPGSPSFASDLFLAQFGYSAVRRSGSTGTSWCRRPAPREGPRSSARRPGRGPPSPARDPPRACELTRAEARARAALPHALHASFDARGRDGNREVGHEPASADVLQLTKAGLDRMRRGLRRRDVSLTPRGLRAARARRRAVLLNADPLQYDERLPRR